MPNIVVVERFTTTFCGSSSAGRYPDTAKTSLSACSKRRSRRNPETGKMDEARGFSGDFLSDRACLCREPAARAKVIEEFIDEFARGSA
jgi:hypothetical protein